MTGAKNLWLDRLQTQEKNRLLLVCWMGKVPNRLLMLYCVAHGLLQISSCIRDTSFCNRWQRKTHCQVAEHKRRHTNCSSLNGTSVSHPLLLRSWGSSWNSEWMNVGAKGSGWQQCFNVVRVSEWLQPSKAVDGYNVAMLWRGWMTTAVKGSGWIQYYSVFKIHWRNCAHVLIVIVYAQDLLMLKIDKIPAWSKKVGTISLP